jgi:predicted solute-binding protein
LKITVEVGEVTVPLCDVDILAVDVEKRFIQKARDEKIHQKRHSIANSIASIVHTAAETLNAVLEIIQQYLASEQYSF